MAKINFTKEIRPSAYQRYLFTADKANELGETLQVEVTEVRHNLKDKKSLMNLWVKEGWLEKPLESFWSVDTYATDPMGLCKGKYNPTHYSYKKTDSKGRVILSNMRIDFDWMYLATEENLQLLLDEVVRQFIEMTPTRRVEEVEE